jgi:hypothetical protein
MRIFSSLKLLSIIMFINVIIAGILSYFDLVFLSYIFYTIPFILFIINVILVLKVKVSVIKERKSYYRNKGRVKGLILNKNNKPFSYILVQLSYLDGSIGPNFSNRYYTVTDDKGKFEINRIPYGNFLLRVTYKTSTQEFPVEFTEEKPVIDFIKIL